MLHKKQGLPGQAKGWACAPELAGQAKMQILSAALTGLYTWQALPAAQTALELSERHPPVRSPSGGCIGPWQLQVRSARGRNDAVWEATAQRPAPISRNAELRHACDSAC